MKRIFLRNSCRNPKQGLYMACFDEGQSVNEVIIQYGTVSGGCLVWTGNIREITTDELAKIYIDNTVKDESGHHRYKDYRCPSNSLFSVASAHASFMTAVQALSKLVNRDINDIVVFHT